MEPTTPDGAGPLGKGHGEQVAGTPTRYGRRGIVLGAATAGAGVAIGALARSTPASAADGSTLFIGESNTAADTTSLSTTAGDGLMASTTQTGQSGVEGEDKSSGGG